MGRSERAKSVELKELKQWLIGRKIIKVDRKEAILALGLDDDTTLIIYSEVFAKGVKNKGGNKGE